MKLSTKFKRLIQSIYFKNSIIMTNNTYNVNEQGYYGEYGGAYIPEILFNNVEELKNNYLQTDNFET